MNWMGTFLAGILACHSGAAETADPRAVVQEIFTRASAPEIARESQRQSEVNALVDFDELARSALGREFGKTPAAEFGWFRDTLQEIIARTVYPKAPDFLKGVKISYGEGQEAAGKNRIRVKSTVQNKADLTDVDYVLARSASGSWKVVDVSISGQSWVESIRDQVASVLRKKKWKGLRDSMSRRLNELKKEKA